MNKYKVYYYVKENGRVPVREYILNQDNNTRAKIHNYIDYLEINGVYMRGHYSKYIVGKIWELRVDFSKKCHRIFYFIYSGKKIILLHAFTKKSDKTPRKEITMAKNYYNNYISKQKYD